MAYYSKTGNLLSHEKYSQAILDVLTWNKGWALINNRVKSWCGLSYDKDTSEVIVPGYGLWLDQEGQERVSRFIAATVGSEIDWDAGEQAAASEDYVTFSRAVWGRVPEGGRKPINPSLKEKDYLMKFGLEHPFRLRDKIMDIVMERGDTWEDVYSEMMSRRDAREKAWNACRPLLWKKLVYNQPTDEENFAFDPTLDPAFETLFTLVWDYCDIAYRIPKLHKGLNRKIREKRKQRLGQPALMLASSSDQLREEGHSPNSPRRITRRIGTPSRCSARLATGVITQAVGARSNAPSSPPSSFPHIPQEHLDKHCESSITDAILGRIRETLAPRFEERRGRNLNSDAISLCSDLAFHIATSGLSGPSTRTVVNTQWTPDQQLKLEFINAYQRIIEELSKLSRAWIQERPS